MSEQRIPETPAPAQTGPRPPRGLTGAILLIEIGVVFLLNNMGVISVNWWQIAQFWPVILILIGLDVILGRRSFIGSMGVAALTLLAVVVITIIAATSAAIRPFTAEAITRDVAVALEDASALEIRLEMGAGDVRLDALEGADYAVQGTYTTNSQLELVTDYRVAGDTGQLTIRQTGEDNRIGPTSYVGGLELGLNDSVPIDLVVEAGVGGLTLDLSGVQLRSLTVNMGVGGTEVILPTPQGNLEVNIDGGVGGIEITLPAGVEARINYDGGLSDLDTPLRFARSADNVRQTEGYNSATGRITLTIDMGIGGVDVSD